MWFFVAIMRLDSQTNTKELDYAIDNDVITYWIVGGVWCDKRILII
ncbi:hypothetical protein [uncultured Helicobacter sp.]